MSDPFGFKDARPARPGNEGGVQHVEKSTAQVPAKSGTLQAATASQLVQPHKARRGRPPAEPESIKVELMGAIRAAAILDETDANAFESIIAILNLRDRHSRSRIARALVAVFA